MRIGRSASLTSGPILSTTSKYQIQNILTKQIRVKKIRACQMRIGRSASLTSGPILSTTSKYQIQNILTKQIRVKKTNQTNQFD
jgi:hypothetical protein